MPQAIFKTNLKVKLAELLSDEFKTSNQNSYFLFIGKITPWDNENNPSLNTDSIEESNEAWRNSFFVKRILSKDIRMIVPRFYWSPNEVYTQYTDNQDLYDESIPGGSSNFFVVSPENHVYKCMFNNGRAESTIMPTGTSPNVIKTSDGYAWKYMYSLLPDDLNFSTSGKMPVHRAVVTDNEPALVDQWAVQQNAVRGSMDFVEIENAGAKFIYATTGGVPIGSSAAAGTTAVSIPFLSDISTTNNIYKGYTIQVVSGEGTGQVRKIVNSTPSGTLYVSEAWSEGLYSDDGMSAGASMVAIIPTIETFGDGSELYLIPQINSQKLVDGITVVNRGKDYTKIEYSLYPGITGPYFAGGGHRSEVNTLGETTLNFVSAPLEGHGSDAPKELGSDSMMIYIRLDEDEFETLGMQSVNEFRQFGIIMNPTTTSSYDDGSHEGKNAAALDSDTYELIIYPGSAVGGTGFQMNEFNKDWIDQTGTNDGSCGGTASYMVGNVSNALAQIKGITFNNTTKATVSITKPLATFTETEQLSWFSMGVSGSGISSVEKTIELGVFNQGRAGKLKQTDQNYQIFDNTVRVSLDATGNQAAGGVGLTDESFGLDEFVSNYTTGISGSSFRVLSWDPGLCGVCGYGDLRGIDYFAGLQTGDYLYDSDGITQGQVTGVTGPELNYNAGEVLYIQNMRPIERSPQQEEEIKIMIGF